MKVIVILLLPIIAFGGLEGGKSTYHPKSLDKKVEFSSRHKENPTFSKTKKVKNPLAKEVEKNKHKVHTVLTKEKKAKVLSTSRKSLADLRKEVSQNKSIKKKKIKRKSTSKNIKKKAYKYKR